MFAATEDEVIERIKPRGQVHVMDEEKVEKTSEVKTTIKVSQPGQETYESHCITCHQAGLAGAPKFRDAADWKPRMVRNIDELVAIAIKGLNAMPPKGTCMDCSDEDIKHAILYMMPGDHD